MRARRDRAHAVAAPVDVDLAGHVDRIVLVAHGSPDPRHGVSLRATATRLAALSGVEATCAFLQHDAPLASEALAPAPAGADPRGTHTTVVVPLLLTAGVHWHRDLPPVVGRAGQRSLLLAPPHLPDLATAVLATMAGSGPAGRVVLAGAGSRQPDARERLDALANAVSAQAWRTGRHVADVVVAERPAEVAGLAGPGDVVVPLLIADGIFADRIRTAAQAVNARVTEVAGETPAFADEVLRQVAAATVPDRQVRLTRRAS